MQYSFNFRYFKQGSFLSARENIDFIPVSGLMLEIPVNSVTGARVCSVLTVIGDIFAEGTEFFHIVVTPTNSLDKAANIGRVFIANDDQSKSIMYTMV